MSIGNDRWVANEDGGIVVLCAEEAVRASIAYWATSIPVRMLVADDGYQAHQALRDGTWRLLVTDRVLPPWPGLDTFLQLREGHPRLRIAFVEGVRRDDVGLARLIGATDVLPRPLKRQSLIDAVDAAMRV